MVTEPSIINHVIAKNGDKLIEYASNKKAVYEKMISWLPMKK